MQIPNIYQAFVDAWQDHRNDYCRLYKEQAHSFIPNLLPELAIKLSAEETLSILRDRLGSALDLAIDPLHTDPEKAQITTSPAIPSPVSQHRDGEWLKKTNMIGINVRTVRNFWNVVKYMLVIPDYQDSVHLLPIWEPGVVDSLYGMSSWKINNEFFSEELASALPHLNSTERQLKALINILHAMGRTVGMDVIPHTDRYSEMALAQPAYFEWLQRQDTEIVNHQDALHSAVETHIMRFLNEYGSAVEGLNYPNDAGIFFSPRTDEGLRLRVLFGEPEDREGRNRRRGELVQFLYAYGYEPVPATMAPPFRGIKVDLSAKTVDSIGQTWRDYQIIEPQSMSRVFNPLARYKFYGRLNDNQDWEIDFDKPRGAVWDYVCRHYHEVQHRYGFDFMRGDMSHVQMRVNGVPDQIDRFYDVLGAVKGYIRQHSAPYFAYFAETFLPPRDIFGYGEEIDHLEASDAETTLGDLQSTVIGSYDFMYRLRQYIDLKDTRLCIPSFTVMTGDKDDPRFDEFYVKGNEVRFFMALFLTDMPSYMALGFQTRDVHYAPVPNEHYTKLFVFHETSGSKGREGLDYIWGKNGYLFGNLTRLKLYAETILPAISGAATRWLIAPDPTAERKIIAWTQPDAQYVFVANLDIHQPSNYFALPAIKGLANEKLSLRFDFSTHTRLDDPRDADLSFNGKHFRIEGMQAGEGRVYRLSQ